ncbi:MAG: glycosyltransferase [Nitrospira sp.]
MLSIKSWFSNKTTITWIDMKIVYIASIRLPTEKAHGVQIMKTCEAFSENGIKIKLFVPNFIFDKKRQDAFEYYGVKKAFEIKKFFSVRLIRLGPIGFFLETFIFFLSVIFSSDFWLADYVFSRDEMLVVFSGILGKKTIWETHTGSYNFFARVSLKTSTFVVSISKGLKDFYISKDVNPSKIIVAHDGVDLDDFQVSLSKEEARKSLGLPLDKKIVLYAGRLDGWKGSETFFEASKSFDDSTVAVVVGGEKNQIEMFNKKYPKIIFIGYRPYKELPLFQKTADVLVVPNTGKDNVSRLYTSPLKVFSAMASGVPIVASDLPSIREVLADGGNSVLVLPDSPEALFEGIMGILGDETKAGIIAKQALSDVSGYSWKERVRVVISYISK